MPDITVTVGGAGEPRIALGAPNVPRLRVGGGSADYPHYRGPDDVTPTTTAQTLATKGTVLDADIIIEPIPSNYGLITWNGSALTVS